MPGVKVPGGAFGADMVGGRDPGALAGYAAAMTGGLRVRGKAAVWSQAGRESDTAMRLGGKEADVVR